MAVSSGVVTIGTAAVPLNLPETDGNPGQSIVVKNHGTAVFYLGGAAVGTATGLQVLQDEAVYADLQPNDVLYAVSAGTATAHVLSVHT